MNKNVLILSSSPRRGGNSDRLCDAFLQGCKDAGHTVEKIFLKDKHINYCTGCGICSMYGKPCPQKDDAAEVIEKMIAADVIVMATPVYFYTMSAQMKTLIDRCCARYTEITNKNFYFIVTAAEPSIPAMEGEKENREKKHLCVTHGRPFGWRRRCTVNRYIYLANHWEEQLRLRQSERRESA